MGGDAQLKKHVEEELSWESSIDDAAIGVSVHDAIVTLSGHVRNYAEKISAERAVLRIRGVRALISNLDVMIPDTNQRTDEDIAETAAAILRWNTQLPEDMVKVKVHSGVVTLSGEVEFPYQKKAAEREVSRLMGVKGFINDIRIKPPSVPAIEKIKAGIEAALKRSAEVEAQGIGVRMDGSTVTLTGTVSSWPERNAAERAAWAGTGVSRVDNKILINCSMAAAT